MNFDVSMISDNDNLYYATAESDEKIFCLIMIYSEELSIKLIENIICKAMEQFLSLKEYSNKTLKSLFNCLSFEYSKKKEEDINLEFCKVSVCIILSDYNSMLFLSVGQLQLSYSIDDKLKYICHPDILSYEMYEKGKIKLEDVYKINQSNILTNYLTKGDRVRNIKKIDLETNSLINIKNLNAQKNVSPNNLTIQLKLLEKSNKDMYIKDSRYKLLLYFILFVIILLLIFVGYKKYEINVLIRKNKETITAIKETPLSPKVKEKILEADSRISLIGSKYFISNNKKLELYKQKIEVDELNEEYDKLEYYIKRLTVEDLDVILKTKKYKLNLIPIFDNIIDKYLSINDINNARRYAKTEAQNQKIINKVNTLKTELKNSLEQDDVYINLNKLENLVEQVNDRGLINLFKIKQNEYNLIKEDISKKMSLAKNYYKEKEYQKSYNTYDYAKNLAISIKDQKNIKIIEEIMLDVKNDLTKYNNSITNTKSLQNIQIQYKKNYEKALNLELMGDNLVKENNFKEAIKLYKQSIRLVVQDQSKTDYINSLENKIKYILQSVGINE